MTWAGHETRMNKQEHLKNKCSDGRIGLLIIVKHGSPFQTGRTYVYVMW
jgi:hypothetical protein